MQEPFEQWPEPGLRLSLPEAQSQKAHSLRATWSCRGCLPLVEGASDMRSSESEYWESH